MKPFNDNDSDCSGMFGNTYCGESRRVLILANGPSAKLVDFSSDTLSFIATVGMNSAFRYWKEIDFRPTHYICMDLEVTKSIAKEIYELIREGRIEYFFLRNEIQNIYPELRKDERILWFNEAKTAYPIFDCRLVTTGSWAIRWMLYAGMNEIATIGIDGVQVEVLKEARHIGKSGGLQLRIEKTPEFNPNYFFSGYQKAGDVYNVPNDPRYTAKHGQVMHTDALRMTSDDQKRLYPETTILDLSPSSEHKIFQKKSYYNWNKTSCLMIITAVNKDCSNKCLIDIVSCAIANSKNPLVSKVHILMEGDKDLSDKSFPSNVYNELIEFQRHERIIIHDNVKNLSYRFIFEYSNQYCNSSNVAVLNSTVTPSPSVIEEYLRKISYTESVILSHSSLSNYYQKDYVYDDEKRTDELHTQSNVKENIDSLREGWVFKTPINIPAGCENIQPANIVSDKIVTALLRVESEIVCSAQIHNKKRTDCIASRISNEIDLARGNEIINVFRSNLLARYNNSDSLLKKLKTLTNYMSKDAWIGQESCPDVWLSLLNLISYIPYFNKAPIFKKICLSKEDIDNNLIDLSWLLSEVEEKNLFLEWELSGYNSSKSISRLFLAKKKYQDLGKFLENYPWQSTIFTDIASAATRADHFDLMLVVKDVLNDSMIDDAPEENSVIGKSVKEIILKGDQQKASEGYMLGPPSVENYVAYCYPNWVAKGERVTASVSFYLAKDSVLSISLCRNGGNDFEGARSKQAFKQGENTVIIEHTFKTMHSGVRVQIGSETDSTYIYNIKIDLCLDMSKPLRVSDRISFEKIIGEVENQSNAVDVVILDLDGKSIRGHYIAYCDQLLDACEELGVKAEVWCRNDLDSAVIKERGNFKVAFKTHSWTIATNERKFYDELKNALESYSANKSSLLVYLYTGSLYHARVLLSLSKDYPEFSFNCNLFWEMIRDISTPEYEKLARTVSLDLEGNSRVSLTVPTKKLQSMILRRFNLFLPIAPHPSTAVSDTLFKKIIERDSNFKKEKLDFKVVFPGAATQSKGYDLGLATAKILAGIEKVTCWVRDEGQGEIPSNVNIIPDSLSSEDFIELLNGASVVVIPYLPEGFEMRTSGIVVDSMYLGTPTVVCEGTWLGDYVGEYGVGVVSKPTVDDILESIFEVKRNYDKYSTATLDAAKYYFEDNSWRSLVRFLTKNQVVKGYDLSVLPVKANFIEANKLFRSGNYEAALLIYMQLNSTHPQKLYRDNITLCENRMRNIM